MIGRVFIILMVGISFSFCEDGETRLEKKNQFQSEFLITLLKYREEGNCRKTVTSDNKVDKTTTCNRNPRGFCSTNQSLITQGEVSYLLTEAKKVRDRTPDCETSFLQSGILLTSATSQSDEQTIRANQEFVTITTCEDDGFVLAGNTKLASFEELKLLATARGKIGRTAKALSINILATVSIKEKAKLCLENEFTESERAFFGDLLVGKIVTEVSK